MATTPPSSSGAAAPATLSVTELAFLRDQLGYSAADLAALGGPASPVPASPSGPTGPALPSFQVMTPAPSPTSVTRAVTPTTSSKPTSLLDIESDVADTPMQLLAHLDALALQPSPPPAAQAPVLPDLPFLSQSPPSLTRELSLPELAPIAEVPVPLPPPARPDSAAPSTRSSKSRKSAKSSIGGGIPPSPPLSAAMGSGSASTRSASPSSLSSSPAKSSSAAASRSKSKDTKSSRKSSKDKDKDDALDATPVASTIPIPLALNARALTALQLSDAYIDAYTKASARAAAAGASLSVRVDHDDGDFVITSASPRARRKMMAFLTTALANALQEATNHVSAAMVVEPPAGAAAAVAPVVPRRSSNGLVRVQPASVRPASFVGPRTSVILPSAVGGGRPASPLSNPAGRPASTFSNPADGVAPRYSAATVLDYDVAPAAEPPVAAKFDPFAPLPPPPFAVPLRTRSADLPAVRDEELGGAESESESEGADDTTPLHFRHHQRPLQRPTSGVGPQRRWPGVSGAAAAAPRPRSMMVPILAVGAAAAPPLSRAEQEELEDGVALGAGRMWTHPSATLASANPRRQSWMIPSPAQPPQSAPPTSLTFADSPFSRASGSISGQHPLAPQLHPHSQLRPGAAPVNASRRMSAMLGAPGAAPAAARPLSFHPGGGTGLHGGPMFPPPPPGPLSPQSATHLHHADTGTNYW
ncbi:hypothetical protein H9P43_005475 [Blastocladiella emersonii ATCC 22665]|nr:hypothetical protein H9P43_005475 [Blastocladiella emersonii ATCC 22665]